MEHAQTLPQSPPFPWRAVAVLAAAVALAELVALVAIGLIQLAPGGTAAKAKTSAKTAPALVTRRHKAPAVHARRVASVPLRPPSRTRVLVLNGNGVTGAAAAGAAHLRADGYRIAAATDAQRHDYAQSMVMFVPGWAKEARHLARTAGVRLVTPVDGLGRAQLHGAKVILLLGR